MFGFGGIGAPELVILSILALAGVWRLALPRSPVLVLQRMQVDFRTAAPALNRLEIVGRAQGVIAFVLSLMGLSPITRLSVADDEVRYESSSLSGIRSQFVPLRSVSNVASGIHKPIAPLVFAAFAFVNGFIVTTGSRSFIPLMVTTIVAGVLVVVYFLSRKFFVEIHAEGGPPIVVRFRPNVIEGVAIDATQVERLVLALRQMVLRMHDVASIPDSPASPPMVVSPWIPNGQNDQPPVDDSEDEAERIYAQARHCAKSGERDMAVAILQDLIGRFPATRAAEQARRNLERSGRPAG